MKSPLNWRTGARLLIVLLPVLTLSVAPAAASELARAYLDTFQPSDELQGFLDSAVAELLAADSSLKEATVSVAIADLDAPGGPRLAGYQGNIPLYPASVVKFVYLMAAYRWAELGKLTITDPVRWQLREMIHHSSNDATQWVFSRLTSTRPGAELGPEEYRKFRERRFAVKRWLLELGITELHCVHPTYNGNGDLFGRDVQFLKDHSIPDGGQGKNGGFYNRQMMTARDTVKLLALLATNRALSPQSTTTVLEMMRRDVAVQPYLQRRIAGGAARLPGLEVFSKTGTFAKSFADAGIVRHVSGRQMVLCVFIEAPQGYRGTFIPDLTERCAARILLPAEVLEP